MSAEHLDCVLEVELPRDGLRAREVISRSKARSSGKYPSWKLLRMVTWESPHELNAFRLLDACPTVDSFSEQPLTVRYQQSGVEHFHVPDVLVCLSGRRELWEIKTHKDSQAPDIHLRTVLMQRDLPRFGYEYRLVTAETLGRQPRLANALTVLRYGRGEIRLSDRESLRLWFELDPGTTLGEIRRGALGVRGFGSVCRLILEGALHVEINATAFDEEPVRPQRRSAQPVRPSLLTQLAGESHGGLHV